MLCKFPRPLSVLVFALLFYFYYPDMTRGVPGRINFERWAKESNQPYGGASDAFNLEFPEIFTTLRSYKVPDYRPMGDFTLEADFDQRMTEGAWPIRSNPNSKYIVTNSQNLKSLGLGTCTIMFAGKRLTLVRC
jgi:hypothetical protein